MSTSDPLKLSLPRFQAALPDERKSLSAETYRRYRRGIYPKFAIWLVQHPALMHAFCADAAELHRSPPAIPDTE